MTAEKLSGAYEPQIGRGGRPVVWTPPPPDTNHCKPSMLPSAMVYLVIVLAVVAGIWIVALK